MGFDPLSLFAVSPPGLEAVVAGELERIGGSALCPMAGGVEFQGDRETLYRANLWLRVAGRVLVRVDQFFAVHLAKLHKKAGAVPWERYLNPHLPIAVKGVCRKSRIYHSKAAAERVAIGIAERLGLPEIPRFADAGLEEESTAAQVLVRIERDHCTLSVDSSGDHLHRRGYRTESLEAPLRENLAAAALILAGRHEREALVDPMCGSGTIPIEAALLATNRAPGLSRRFAFMDWPDFDETLWQRLINQAENERAAPRAPILASDIDAEAVWTTERNAERAGVASLIDVTRKSVESFDIGIPKGLLLTNPPYGKRIGVRRKLRALYGALGKTVQRLPNAWRLGLITSDLHFAAATGLEFGKTSAPFPNGGVRVRLYLTA